MTKAERKAEKTRMDQIGTACQDEQIRFNAAIKAGKKILLPTFSGDYQIRYVDHEWFYHTGVGGFTSEMSWAGCNNGIWAKLLREAGVPRNPLFLSYS